MYTSFIRACFILFVLILSVSAHAAGLGKMTVNSALGQPFNAEIDLVTVNAEDLSSLTASIASLEAYAQANIQYEAYFSSLKLSIESRANGRPYIKLSSPQAINEPFLNLLVELNWSSGRLLREYIVLLDPVDTKRSEPVAPIVRAAPEESVNSISTADNVRAETASASAQPATETSLEQSQKPIPAPESRLSRRNSTDTTYGPVLQGDTLSSIARQVKPDGVNVNQMLVALFRANRDAFIANNMNLLRTGAVLKIPGIEESTAITRQQADAEVKLQVSNWQKYRENLAQTVQQSDGQAAIKQTDSGQITTTLNDSAIASRETPQEVLRLSSGEHISDAASAQSGENALQRLRMMEEDAIARSMALKEANERIALLENNIDNLQKLLSLQNTELAKAQANAQTQLQSSPTGAITQQESDAHAEIESIEVLTPESDKAYYSEYDLLSELADEGLDLEKSSSPRSPESTASNTASVEHALPAAASALLPSESSTEKSSFVDGLASLSANNIVYLGAALIILPLVWLMFRMRTRSKENEILVDEIKPEENAANLRNKAAAAVAAAHVGSSAMADNTQEDLDAFDQDSDLLQDKRVNNEPEAVEDTPSAESSIALDFSREIDRYSAESLSQASNDASDFDLSESIKQESTSSQSFDEIIGIDADDDKSSEVQQVEQDRGEDEHLLDFSEQEPHQSIEESSIALDFDYEASTEASDEIKSTEIEALEIDLTHDNMEPGSTAEIPAETPHNASMENSLEFSIDSSAVDLSDENALHEQSSEIVSGDDLNMLDLLDSDALELEAEEPKTEDSSLKNSAEIDFSGIDLDLENTADVQSTDIEEETLSTNADTKNEQWHEVETKIDLAKAYLDMEDKEGAREMLEEAILEGDSKQQEVAKALLKDL